MVTPAVDWLLARPDVDPDRIALMGMSFGGLLAPRVAATEHRVAALIAYDGIYSFADLVHRLVGPEIMKLVDDDLPTSDAKANALIKEIMSSSTQTFGPAFPWGMWVLGSDGPAAFVRAVAPYTIEGYAPLITCPTLVLDGENDPGNASQLHQAPAARRPTTFSPRQKGAASTAKKG